MSLQTESEILEAAEHLPDGATLIIPQVSWDEYERLLEDLAGRARFRVSYDCGRLEIVTQLPQHGDHERLIEDLARAACEAFRVKLEKRGGATWKRQSLLKGAEGDASYYIENAQRIIGKREINLESDPPPDIVVEVDLTSDSHRKFPIYAALGVSDIWLYNGHICRIFGLAEGKYIEIPFSRFLPGLTGQMIAEAIELSKTRGQDEALRVFRRKVRKLVSVKVK